MGPKIFPIKSMVLKGELMKKYKYQWDSSCEELFRSEIKRILGSDVQTVDNLLGYQGELLDEVRQMRQRIKQQMEGTVLDDDLANER